MKERLNKMENNKEFEECVICKKPTTTPIDLPISKRTNFIVGVGEVCSKCMLEVYCNINPFGEE